MTKTPLDALPIRRVHLRENCGADVIFLARRRHGALPGKDCRIGLACLLLTQRKPRPDLP